MERVIGLGRRIHRLIDRLLRLSGRLRARLAIRGRVGSPKLGLFELGTHRVVHTPRCPVHHPLINEVAAVVRRALIDTRTSCYSDKAHLGLARYLQVVIERSSGTAQVVLVGNSADAGPLAECLELIRERLGARLHSLWFNSQTEPINTILGQRFEHITGPECVIEHFGAAAIHYPPGAFGQSNLEMATAIVEHLRGLIPAEADVAEFYAGVGAIGLSVLPGLRSLSLNELNPHSLHGLHLGLAQLPAADRARTRVFAGSAATALDATAQAQVVIVDPTRKGLDLELRNHLRDHPPEHLLYVSCSLPSLLEDTAILTAGALRLTGLTAFNLLPFTEHVESVAHFRRA